MWLRQNPPMRGEWGSAGVSEKRWWSRWCEAHQSGPFCAAAQPSAAKANWTMRPALKAWWEKYRWYHPVMANMRAR